MQRGLSKFHWEVQVIESKEEIIDIKQQEVIDIRQEFEKIRNRATQVITYHAAMSNESITFKST